jgi:hypothetical protein
MPRMTVKLYPGRGDINAQFSAQNIRKTLALYKTIKTAGGDYQFGELTTLFYNLNQNEVQAWQDDLKTYSTEVQEEIKRQIIHALTHVDSKGNETPVPLTITWKTGTKAVTTTYDPSGPSYAIVISGFPMPALKPFSQRRPKRKRS